MPVNMTAIKTSAGNTEKAACRRLQALAGEVRPGEIVVELGAYKGRTTAYLASGCRPGVRVLSVDPWDLRPAESWPTGYVDHLAFDTYGKSETRDAYFAHIAACGLTNVDPVQGFAAQVGDDYDGPPVGLLYHDAEHSTEAVIKDLLAWMPHLSQRCVIALHDAGNPNFGVVEGASAVLNTPDWSWRTRSLYRWKKHPDRRGLLVVRR